MKKEWSPWKNVVNMSRTFGKYGPRNWELINVWEQWKKYTKKAFEIQAQVRLL